MFKLFKKEAKKSDCCNITFEEVKDKSCSDENKKEDCEEPTDENCCSSEQK